MARDHALALSLRTGRGVARFYRWSPATLSLGRHEPLAADYLDFLRRRPDLGVVRRPTGGRAVIHDRELTYAVALSARSLGGPREAYRRINLALVEGLRRLGVDARAGRGRSLPPDAGPCFRAVATGEVVVGGRKLVGSAQARIGEAMLQHGSVLLAADQRGLPNGGAAGGGRFGGAATLGQVLGSLPPWEDLVSAFRGGFAQVLGGVWTRGGWLADELALAQELTARYASAAWTRRC